MTQASNRRGDQIDLTAGCWFYRIAWIASVAALAGLMAYAVNLVIDRIACWGSLWTR